MKKDEQEPEVPSNYFGKGDNYILPDDVDEVRKFEDRWKKYEAENPDDPTGELALAKFRNAHPPTNQPKPPDNPPDRIVLPENFEWKEIELILPVPYVERFKNFAAAKRRRPRDILMSFIDKYCPNIKPD